MRIAPNIELVAQFGPLELEFSAKARCLLMWAKDTLWRLGRARAQSLFGVNLALTGGELRPALDRSLLL